MSQSQEIVPTVSYILEPTRQIVYITQRYPFQQIEESPKVKAFVDNHPLVTHPVSDIF